MKLEIKLALVFLISVMLSACATNDLQAPCDQYATTCGTKTKINQ